jgi:hypothetical protein
MRIVDAPGVPPGPKIRSIMDYPSRKAVDHDTNFMIDEGEGGDRKGGTAFDPGEFGAD